jgi:hypothetical protein
MQIQSAKNSKGSGLADLRKAIRLAFGGPRLGLWFIITLLMLWELSARTGLVTSSNWPPVSAVLVATVRDLGKGELAGGLGGTLYRMAVGFVLGAAAGIVLGVLLSVSRLTRAALEPTTMARSRLSRPIVLSPRPSARLGSTRCAAFCCRRLCLTSLPGCASVSGSPLSL